MSDKTQESIDAISDRLVSALYEGDGLEIRYGDGDRNTLQALFEGQSYTLTLTKDAPPSPPGGEPTDRLSLFLKAEALAGEPPTFPPSPATEAATHKDRIEIVELYDSKAADEGAAGEKWGEQLSRECDAVAAGMLCKRDQRVAAGEFDDAAIYRDVATAFERIARAASRQPAVTGKAGE